MLDPRAGHAARMFVEGQLLLQDNWDMVCGCKLWCDLEAAAPIYFPPRFVAPVKQGQESETDFEVIRLGGSEEILVLFVRLVDRRQARCGKSGKAHIRCRVYARLRRLAASPQNWDCY